MAITLNGESHGSGRLGSYKAADSEKSGPAVSFYALSE